MNILEQALAWLAGPKTRPSGIDRRAFLQVLGGTALGVAIAPLIDVERILWTPSPTIVVPEVGYGFVTTDWIVREAMRILTNELTMDRCFDREYDEPWGDHQIGSTVSVSGGRSVPLTTQPAIEVCLTRVQYEEKVDRPKFSREVIAPAAKALARTLPERVVFGELPIPEPFASHGLLEASRFSRNGGGPSIRAIKGEIYDPVFDSYGRILRLDVLHGEV